MSTWVSIVWRFVNVNLSLSVGWRFVNVNLSLSFVWMYSNEGWADKSLNLNRICLSVSEQSAWIWRACWLFAERITREIYELMKIMIFWSPQLKDMWGLFIGNGKTLHVLGNLWDWARLWLESLFHLCHLTILFGLLIWTDPNI